MDKFKTNDQYGAISLDVMHMRGLSLGAKGVYAFYCTEMGSGKYEWLSFEYISVYMDISTNMVERFVDELVENGIIEKGEIRDDA